MSPNWLPLTEYSSKHRVSISTLRRRIKAKDIKFQLKEGRYLIADEQILPTEPMETEESSDQRMRLQKHRPSLKDTSSPSLKRLSEKNPENSPASFSEKLDSLIGAQANPERAGFVSSAGKVADEPILTAANRLLSELKKAYTQILQEKEEQILHLKEEVNDLKTLVRVLESENQRLR